ncbi:MAG: YfiR family protein [Gammaproteobacteria bacterium]|nr:YfiR family protein [Gammaproteobacteria bacterium]MBU1775084.1 YfiR family protein [Gammaproteobacteria bacterium]MBU1969258.1 YfiR family protein [Gammaproteobacteria bacterium]
METGMHKAHRTGRCWLALSLLLLLLPVSGAGQEQLADPYRIEAAFLRNFAHYVIWPDSAFRNSEAPWCVAVLGRDPFGDVLETTFKGRTEQGRSFVIFRADKPEELPPCQIVFVAHRNATKRNAALAALKGKPVLTVGDAPGFLREGGVIRFQVSDRVRMSINLDQARAASLNIPTRMLEVASEVMENDTVHKVRER